MNQKLIDEMLKSNKKLYLSITGGGSRAISMLLENGGASDMFLGAVVPYSHTELTDLVGSTDKAVCERTAMLLSLTAYNRNIADELIDGMSCVGVGATSSLVKADGEREGREHKVHLYVSIITSEGHTNRECAEITLKDTRSRKDEEDVVANLILMIADMNLCLHKAHWFHPTYRKSLNKESGLTDKDEVKWHLL
jgi:nicotinamide mononucleotide (NMN) deamidase PncC